MPKVVKFTLQDADAKKGDPGHEYEVTLHPPGDGQVIMWQLVGMAAGPLAAGIGGVIPLFSLFQDVAGQGGLTLRQAFAAVRDDPSFMVKAKEALAGVDFGRVGGEVQKSIVMNNMPELTRAIFSRTTRDGRRLENKLAFDEAYEGNYGEMLLALGRVVQTNRFLPGVSGI